MQLSTEFVADLVEQSNCNRVVDENHESLLRRLRFDAELGRSLKYSEREERRRRFEVEKKRSSKIVDTEAELVVRVGKREGSMEQEEVPSVIVLRIRKEGE